MQNKDNQSQRLKYHIMPPKGWMNDPNGMCFFQGKYHAFFQYEPNNVYGGATSWGHNVSEDLIHWEFLGEAIRPDSDWDKDGSYSGCAFVEDGLMELFYTGNVKEPGDYDYIHEGRQANVLYVTSQDGVTFSEKKCLMKNADYPADYTCHVRDPKVWKENGRCYMVLGGRKSSDKGSVLLYSSEDKQKWDFEKEYALDQDFGYMWECPDMFWMEGHQILAVCPQGLEAEEYRYQNKYQSGYFLCEGDAPVTFTEWDMGFDFYAPQTFDDGKRRILVGWAGVPEMEEEYNNQPIIEEGWQHSLTLFRELKWRDGKIYQYPVQEYEKLRKEEIQVTANEAIVPKIYDGEVRFEDPKGGKKLSFGESFVLEYHDGEVILRFLDDSGSGRRERKAKIAHLSNIRIMMDTSMAELYLNDGEMVFTTRWFGNKDENVLKIDGETSSIHIWNI